MSDNLKQNHEAPFFDKRNKKVCILADDKIIFDSSNNKQGRYLHTVYCGDYAGLIPSVLTTGTMAYSPEEGKALSFQRIVSHYEDDIHTQCDIEPRKNGKPLSTYQELNDWICKYIDDTWVPVTEGTIIKAQNFEWGKIKVCPQYHRKDVNGITISKIEKIILEF